MSQITILQVSHLPKWRRRLFVTVSMPFFMAFQLAAGLVIGLVGALVAWRETARSARRVW